MQLLKPARYTTGKGYYFVHRVGQPPHEKAAAFVDFLTAWVSARLKRHSRRSAKPRNFYISARVRLYTPRLVNCGEWHVQAAVQIRGYGSYRLPNPEYH